jgi:hypothetical protein
MIKVLRWKVIETKRKERNIKILPEVKTIVFEKPDHTCLFDTFMQGVF